MHVFHAPLATAATKDPIIVTTTYGWISGVAALVGLAYSLWLLAATIIFTESFSEPGIGPYLMVVGFGMTLFGVLLISAAERRQA